eukprot:753421-Hanusia_phi.AAC.3
MPDGSWYRPGHVAQAAILMTVHCKVMGEQAVWLVVELTLSQSHHAGGGVGRAKTDSERTVLLLMDFPQLHDAEIILSSEYRRIRSHPVSKRHAAHLLRADSHLPSQPVRSID